jgi:hypothetical protein
MAHRGEYACASVNKQVVFAAAMTPIIKGA